ncbi:MAG TPA: alkene reductase [Sphingobium sp.]
MALFAAGRLGDLNLPNRIVMAPLGRGRNEPDLRSPLDRAITYYVQRATAGLIISEATHVAPDSVSRPGTGAIHANGQVAAWRRVTDAVHAANGRIFQQLFHLGRKADPDRLPGGLAPVAPSAVAATGSLVGVDGVQKPFPLPRALDLAGVAAVREQFAGAFANARDAGFDGVELHAANGFLIEQFLRDDANQRDDIYGGSVENRARLLLELVDEAIALLGASAVGVRLSPHFAVDGSGASDAHRLFPYVARELGRRGIAYLHVIEPDATPDARKLAPVLKEAFAGPFILAGEFSRDSALDAIAAGRADFIAFGRLYIANPDLVERFRLPDAPVNDPDVATFYQGGDAGYIDYPVLDTVATAALERAQ